MPSQLTTTLAAHEEKLLACIHCGLCLEACPTYVATGDENDGPRGRIYLMRAVDEGRLPHTAPAFERHINRCLGCRACEPVCPAGVEYGQLLEGARAELQSADVKLSPAHRMLRFGLRHVWLSSTRLKFVFGVARIARNLGLVKLLLRSGLPRLVSKEFEFGLALLESSKRTLITTEKRQKHATKTSPPARKREAVLLFKGCVTEGLFARVNRATKRVLEVNRCMTSVPPRQACCGALHAHAGDLDGARKLARQNIQAFNDPADAPIITNAGGCGAMLVSYEHLFAEDEQWAQRARDFSKRVRDISQQLGKSLIREGAGIGSQPITYDASCHLINGQHVGASPLRILQAIPDLKFVPLAGSDRCCGGAGVYNLIEPELSTRVLDEKLEHIRETGAEVLATGNPGCHMQIAAGAMMKNTPLRVCHPVELLDESYRRARIGVESEAPNQ